VTDEVLVAADPGTTGGPLRSLRKSRGLTQAGLGTLGGLDQTRIAKIERQPGLVSVGQLMKLLAALRVRVLLKPLQEQAAVAEPDPPEW